MAFLSHEEPASGLASSRLGDSDELLLLSLLAPPEFGQGDVARTDMALGTGLGDVQQEVLWALLPGPQPSSQ